MNAEKMWEFFDNTFSPMVHKQVEKITKQPLWYEVWIDLEETFDTRWFEYAFKYPHLAAYNIARWLIRRDKWYWSPSYIAELDNAMAKTNNPAEAFTKVLTNSLNN